MKIVVRTVLLAVALATAAPAFAGGLAPVGEPVFTRFLPADGKVDSAEQVRGAIVEAGRQHGWNVAKDEPGKLTLSLVVRQKHTVVVEVEYDTTGSMISYVSSVNMDYRNRRGVPHIHSSYVRWVSILAAGIDQGTRGL